MGTYTTNTRVAVSAFTRQADEEEVVIGHPETAVFLVLPPDAVELLDSLATGKTVGEVQAAYQAKYGEVPDLEDLLTFLESKGFVHPQMHSRELSGSDQAKSRTGTINSSRPPLVRYHFANFPKPLAQALFCRMAMMSYGGLIALALIAIAADPTIVPGWDAYFFKQNATMMILIMVILDCITLFLHEMAHLVAARALGVSCRMGISHRLWMLVAETDMTGIWSVSRHQRYLPFLAGPLLDTVSASVLVLILSLQQRGLISLPPVIFQIGRALLLNYLLGLLWQCYFFVRTDFYYVLANFFRCKNLMKDTEVFVRNQVARLRRMRQVDQSHIPIKERRVIRLYAILWCLGRVAALYALGFITLPLIWHYSLSLLPILRAGYQANPYAFVDALLMLSMVCIPQGIGLWLWLRSFQLRPAKLS